jgi:predicted transcriptional regulator
MPMRQPLTTSEYRFYFALCQDYPATLNQLRERLERGPYGHSLSVVSAASLANRLVDKGYLEREKISAGHRGQPASLYAPLVPLEQVVESEARRALQELAWDDPEALGIIRRVVEEALEASPASKRGEAGRARPVKKLPRSTNAP